MSLERFLRLHPVLKFGNFSTRVHPSCEGLERPLVRSQHLCRAEPVCPAWQNHALLEGKSQITHAHRQAAILGARDPAGQAHQVQVVKAEAQPTSIP